MNRRQYKKYCKQCFGFIVVCGFIVKKQKYFGKLMQKAYKLKKGLRKVESKRKIICKLPNCVDCGNSHLPF